MRLRASSVVCFQNYIQRRLKLVPLILRLQRSGIRARIDMLAVSKSCDSAKPLIAISGSLIDCNTHMNSWIEERQPCWLHILPSTRMISWATYCFGCWYNPVGLIPSWLLMWLLRLYWLHGFRRVHIILLPSSRSSCPYKFYVLISSWLLIWLNEPHIVPDFLMSLLASYRSSCSYDLIGIVLFYLPVWPSCPPIVSLARLILLTSYC